MANAFSRMPPLRTTSAVSPRSRASTGGAMSQHETPHRVERDSMGEVQVPRDALFGAQTRRALDNFPISNLRKPRRFVQALGAIKLEAANVNHELGLLDEDLRDAIVQAAEQVMEGKLDDHFV